MAKSTVSRPLEFPTSRVLRWGHYALILLLLPMLIVMALVGFILGTYRRALKHAEEARNQAEAHATSAGSF